MRKCRAYFKTHWVAEQFRAATLRTYRCYGGAFMDVLPDGFVVMWWEVRT